MPRWCANAQQSARGPLRHLDGEGDPYACRGRLPVAVQPKWHPARVSRFLGFTLSYSRGPVPPAALPSALMRILAATRPAVITARHAD